MTFAQRETALLPIARRVALGLRALHAADLSHHDLKPANVLVRGTLDGVQFSLADFGFVKPNYYAGTNLKHVGAAIPIGTRHYRSNEQRDYFDVCEVDISEVGGEIKLTSQDRKFRDSIIEEGDTFTFFKNPEYVFTIRKITHDSKEGISTIEAEKASTEAEKTSTVPNDKRTQAIFYKFQTLRTDLFGLGGIMYDLLTAGKSPERFSEFLRAWDQQDRKVVDLMSRYRSYTETSSGGAEIVSLFEHFRTDNEFTYPSMDVVEIILSCLLSNPADSYFKMGQGREIHKQLAKVCEDIQQALARRGAAAVSALDENPLWGSSLDTPPTTEPTTFISEIEAVKREQSVLKRLVLAYRKLMVVVRAARDAWSATLAGGAFFFDFSPDNLRVSSTQAQAVPTYTSQEQFQRALLVGETDGSQGGFGDTFTPPSMRFMTRPAQAIISGSPANRVQLSFFDSHPLWQQLRPGDYVRSLNQEQSLPLFCIESVEQDGLTVAPIQIGPVSEQTLPPGKVLLIRTVRPVEYYLSMIGIYIHHLFFACALGEPGDTGTLPPIVWMIEQGKCSGFLRSRIVGEITRDDLAKRVTGVKLGEFKKVQERLGKIYLWLVCRDFVHKGDWKSPLPEDAGNRAFDDLQGYLQLLRDALQVVTGLENYNLDTPGEKALLDAIKPGQQITERDKDLETVLRNILEGHGGLMGFFG
jgi:serine/threonine protein kinase